MRVDEVSRTSQQGGSPSGNGNAFGRAPSRTARAGLFSSVRLAMLRAAHARWLLLVVAIGILAADALICTVPLYNTLISNVQLGTALTSADSLERNMQIAIRTNQIKSDLNNQILSTVQTRGNQYLSSFSTTPTTYLTTDVLPLIQIGSHQFEGPSNNATAHVYAFEHNSLLPYIHFTAGKAPESAAPGAPMQVMVTQETAGDWHLSVGQTLTVGDFNNNSRRVTATVVGIFSPINPNDQFWNGLSLAVTGDDSLLGGVPNYPILTSTDSFFSQFSAFDGLGMTQTDIYYANPNRISTANMATVADNVVSFRTHASAETTDIPGVANVLTQGGLDQIIQAVVRQLSLTLLPLYVIAAQIVGLALLFVAAMASLLIEYQSQGIATLKSRGVSSTQLLGIFTVQSGLLALVALIAGPALAVGLGLLLVRWFLPASEVQNISIQSALFSSGASPTIVIFPAIIGAVLGVAVVTTVALQAARLDVLAFRREMARPSQTPFWRRAYLDVGLALLCLVGYLELNQFGGTQTRVLLGTQSNSPVLLVTPALLLLAGGLLLLRLIPVVAHLGERIASRGLGLTSMLAFAQIERTPGRYSRMTLLLVLAVGLGLFALTFDASLVQNVSDRTAYATGADVRLVTNPQIEAARQNAYVAHLKTLPGVLDATALYRTFGSTPRDLDQQPVDLLGVDAASFASVANSTSWRSDYADQSLPSLMAELQAHRTPAANITSHPVWTIVSDDFAQQLRLKVGDRFQLSVTDIPFSNPTFVVGAIIHEFPTLYPQDAPGGFIVLDLQDLDNTIVANTEAGISTAGPNEFWLRTTQNAAQHTALLKALDTQRYTLSLNSVDSRKEDLAKAEANPTNGGMRGLLLIGAITAAFLAVLGSLVQSVLAARQRTTQFAIFRTLGMARGQLTRLLLGEQTVVYLLGLIGGTILGLILTTATWPFLQFSDSAVDPTKVGVPPYVLRIDWLHVGIFYGALVVAFVLALALAAQYAARIGLGKALRLGED